MLWSCWASRPRSRCDGRARTQDDRPLAAARLGGAAAAGDSRLRGGAGGGHRLAEEAAPGAAEPRELPDVAAPSPPAPPAARGATRMRPEVLSPGASAARFAVQVGAFAESHSAERLADALRGKGFDVYVSAGASSGEPRWRVRVGPLPSREEAERVATRLKAEEKLPTWVLDEDGPV